ncbi:aldo/keto reductase [Noviherbaspirillum humi]|nr:aldo/keto reductase [Noviherbaspirillum humi]
MNRRDALRLMTAAAISGIGVLPDGAGAANGADQPGMLARRIPSNGESLPMIGLGTWQTFDVGTAPAERAPLEAVLKEFVALGGRLIDSSPMYGNSEIVAGDLTAALGLRQKLFIATKVWTSGKRAGIEQMEDSMGKLRADPIDLMQVHNLVDVSTHLATLREWKQIGRVRHIGVTHYAASAHDAVARVISGEPVDFIQINYSVGEREAERRLLPLARDRGVAVIINRPFAGGDMFRRLRSKPLPGWAAEIDCDSWAQLLLKFVVSHPAVTCAIPATARVEHLRDNMKAGMGRMPDEKMRARIAAEAA